VIQRLGLRRAPLDQARDRDSGILDGVTLHNANLSDDELSELKRLLRARRGGEWSAEERERYEALVGQAAGEPGLFTRLRDEIEKEAAMKAEATKLARAFLPKRRDPEPGSIELPSYLFAWLTNGEANSFDLTDLGLLAR
jgi:hypothetical protein